MKKNRAQFEGAKKKKNFAEPKGEKKKLLTRQNCPTPPPQK